ncbi:hypothetical protein AVEN_66449-1 [Araneus ventricosus]|uniref:Uncharacterized protein n=1 Tax=Araneus ventricosus TaxID=182803 RepID=A0A4Y2VM52_ARAVE|nr:hypothetical protein AVEN_66449-1 [Araneus ventricosus]
MTEIEDGLISSLNENTNKVEVKHQVHLERAEEELESLLDSELDDIHQKELLSSFVEFTDVFHLQDKPVIVSSKVKHRINTGGSSLIKQKPYRDSFMESRVIQEEVDKMLKLGIIEHSVVGWEENVFILKNKFNSFLILILDNELLRTLFDQSCSRSFQGLVRLNDLAKGQLVAKFRGLRNSPQPQQFGRCEAKSLKVSWERVKSRYINDFWSLPQSCGSLDLWKDKVNVPSSFTVVHLFCQSWVEMA